MTTTTERDFYSPTECVKRLGLSLDSWERHIRPALLTGEIASFKIGAKRLVSWSSLIAYLRTHHSGAIQ